jgi:M6 family metalloprotease-like protein/uncharacterized protein (TIGR03382 family)
MARSLRSLVAGLLLTLGAPASADYMDHFVVRDDVGPFKVPYLGPARLLLIPVEVAGHAPLDLAQLGAFFGPEAPGGFVQYFRTASLGRYQPEVTIAPVVRYASCPLPQDAFPNCVIRRGDITALTGGMDWMRDVVRRTAEAGVDFKQFDVNGRRGRPDGWADGVMILANTPSGGIAFPFAYFNQGDNLGGGVGGPLVVDGIRIPHLAISGKSDVWVMIHEFGHLLGLTDLYDETQAYDGVHFSFMGAWRYDPKIPLPDAETRYRLRWANLHQVSGRQEVRIRPVESSGEVYRLGTGEEYFLVENRGPGGAFDREFTHRGLVVYHVDRTVKLRGEEGRFLERTADCVSCDPWRPYIRIIQADGLFQLQQGGWPDYQSDLFRDGDALDEDPTHTPLSATYRVQSSNYYSGAPSGISLRVRQVHEDGTISAVLFAPAVPDVCADALCAEGEGCLPVNCVTEEPPVKEGGCQAVPTPAAAAFLAVVLAWLLRRRATSS